jgi:putative Ca2+/H+ antiporter (TMEM165/GDT1 family)
MHFAIVFAVFPIIFIGELPDKTMFASLVLATRGRPLAVWIGAAAAFIVHVVIATTIGVVLFRFIPHRPLEGVVAAIFFVGGVLAIREAMKEKEIAEDEEEHAVKQATSPRQLVLAAFVVIFLAEWGDLTQILTANLAAHYHSPFSVGVGALAALWSVAAIAVVSGKSLPRLLNLVTIRKVTAVVLFALSGYSVWSAVR